MTIDKFTDALKGWSQRDKKSSTPFPPNHIHLCIEYADFSRTVAYSSTYCCVLTVLPIYIEVSGDNFQYVYRSIKPFSASEASSRAVTKFFFPRHLFSTRHIAKLSNFWPNKYFPLPFFLIIGENTIKLLGVYSFNLSQKSSLLRTENRMEKLLKLLYFKLNFL